MTWANDTTVPRCPHDVPWLTCRACLDGLRPPETDEPSCCELGCWKNPGCRCAGCGGSVDDEDSGMWVGCCCLALAFAAGVALGMWLP